MSLLTRTIELVEFQRSAQVWRYTMDGANRTYAGQTYVSVRGLKRTRLLRAADPEQQKLELTLPMDTDIVGEFIPRPTVAKVYMRLLWLPKGATSAQLRWSGVVSVVSPVSPSKATITGLPLSADASANGLTRNWQKPCPLALYSTGLGMCNASPAARRLDGTATLSDGVTLKAAAWAARADDDFRGGYVEWQDGLHIERRYVVASSGDTLTLLTPASISVGTSVAAFSGCDHTLGANGCAKFANTDNYGGQPNIPDKNPQGSNPVF